MRRLDLASITRNGLRDPKGLLRLLGARIRRLVYGRSVGPYFARAKEELRAYLGDPGVQRDGTAELRDKWNSGTQEPINFYSREAGDSYLFDLSEWHASGDTLRIAANCRRHFSGVVLDFGGGIGSYTLLAASCDRVAKVYYYDINRANEDFTAYRVARHGLLGRVAFGRPASRVDCLIALDVLEHLPDRLAAIEEFAEYLNPGGVLLLTYALSTGEGQIPMHLMSEAEDEPVRQALQRRFRRVGRGDAPQVWRKREEAVR